MEVRRLDGGDAQLGQGGRRARKAGWADSTSFDDVQLAKMSFDIEGDLVRPEWTPTMVGRPFVEGDFG